MIEADKRMAIYLLHQEGMSLKEIVRQLRVSRNMVRAIIKQQGKMPLSTRRDKVRIDADLLERLYQDCDGWMQRVHEKLVEEEGIQVKYSTLTRLLRGLGISKPRETRCERVPDEPGVEFQHDTSSYDIKLAGTANRLIASLMYLRYSKQRYPRWRDGTTHMIFEPLELVEKLAALVPPPRFNLVRYYVAYRFMWSQSRESP